MRERRRAERADKAEQAERRRMAPGLVAEFCGRRYLLFDSSRHNERARMSAVFRLHRKLVREGGDPRWTMRRRVPGEPLIDLLPGRGYRRMPPRGKSMQELMEEQREREQKEKRGSRGDAEARRRAGKTEAGK